MSSIITQQETPDVRYRRIVGRDGVSLRKTLRAAGSGKGSVHIRGNVAPPKPEDIITDDFGDPLNLRRSNLKRVQGTFAKREARLTILTPAVLISRVALETSP